MKSILDEIMNDVFCESFSNFFSTTVSSSAYGTSVRKDDDKTVIEVEMPGTRREDVELSHADGILSVSWKSRGGDKARHFRVSKDVDLSKVKATVAHGLLTVELYRTEAKASKAVKIPVG